ncbi:MAG TPA: ATP-binding protein [Candidatus Methylomirabilis sp.]|nr:ATP-binding protein [Candidatus Methylomirabilis sp.]
MTLALPSDPSLLCAVRGAIERLTESFGFAEEEVRAVTRAVDEALTNIIRHAYNGRADRPIELSFSPLTRPSAPREVDGLEILLTDRGPAVKKEQLCGRSLDELRPGGLGMHFIQESMDVVEYTRTKGTNCLRLVKYIRAPKVA